MKTLFSMLNCGHFHHLDCFFFFRLPPGKKLRINKCRGGKKSPLEKEFKAERQKEK